MPSARCAGQRDRKRQLDRGAGCRSSLHRFGWRSRAALGIRYAARPVSGRSHAAPRPMPPAAPMLRQARVGDARSLLQAQQPKFAASQPRIDLSGRPLDHKADRPGSDPSVAYQQDMRCAARTRSGLPPLWGKDGGPARSSSPTLSPQHITNRTRRGRIGSALLCHKLP